MHHLIHKKGIALVTVLFIAVILLGLGLLLINLVTFENRMSAQIEKERQTFYTADVETTFGTIIRSVLTQEDNWSNFLNAYGAINQGSCDQDTQVTLGCVDPSQEPIPQTIDDLSVLKCRGTILRVPFNSGWNLSSASGNPFSIKCGRQDRFCDCQFAYPDAPQTQFTIYVKDDRRDNDTQNSPLIDNNYELVVSTISTMRTGAPIYTSTIRTSLLFNLTAYRLIEDPCNNPELTGSCEY